MSEQHQTFEGLKYRTDGGVEYWSARDLAPLLEYRTWRNFENVIAKAIQACEHGDHSVSDHFVEASKMVSLGSGSLRELKDFHLSRYACYLVVQNGDPSKPVIAAGQTYFAIQTRRQELTDDAEFQSLRDDQKRLLLRNELREHNKLLVETAQQAGVETELDFAVFQNHGYQGLYGGLDQKAIHQRKGLKKSQKFLITWARLNWPLIYFERLRLKINCVATMFRANNKLTKFTCRLVEKSEKPFPNLAAPCQRSFQCRLPASSSWNLRSKN
ncbi:DNA damage-inducible protein D [Pseudomonas sp. TH43]|uniref:DNA damage-inducible protein D n=1 Tax=Pseudomonas sp. TH43 TaxID=2796407 RepID=UPI001F5BF3B4|nr:DNA damage-inducible protein D [Pseudomonas sp. TH43]